MAGKYDDVAELFVDDSLPERCFISLAFVRRAADDKHF
jgi:hypothetical protein